MKLQSMNFDHSQDGFHTALGVQKDIVIRCRERIFFSHFANSLQSLELFDNRDLAPKEFTTVTGDLQRCLDGITDPMEYELTLLHFMSFHRLATEAFAHYNFLNDPESSGEDKLKLELMKVVAKMKRAMNDDDDDDKDGTGVHDDINIDTVTNRIDVVKKSRYNFSKYMQLMGYVEKDYNEVDKLINGLFD
jgi:hypothetical protein